MAGTRKSARIRKPTDKAKASTSDNVAAPSPTQKNESTAQASQAPEALLSSPLSSPPSDVTTEDDDTSSNDDFEGSDGEDEEPTAAEVRADLAHELSGSPAPRRRAKSKAGPNRRTVRKTRKAKATKPARIRTEALRTRAEIIEAARQRAKNTGLADTEESQDLPAYKMPRKYRHVDYNILAQWEECINELAAIRSSSSPADLYDTIERRLNAPNKDFPPPEGTSLWTIRRREENKGPGKRKGDLYWIVKKDIRYESASSAVFYMQRTTKGSKEYLHFSRATGNFSGVDYTDTKQRRRFLDTVALLLNRWPNAARCPTSNPSKDHLLSRALYIVSGGKQYFPRPSWQTHGGIRGTMRTISSNTGEIEHWTFGTRYGVTFHNNRPTLPAGATWFQTNARSAAKAQADAATDVASCVPEDITDSKNLIKVQPPPTVETLRNTEHVMKSIQVLLNGAICTPEEGHSSALELLDRYVLRRAPTRSTTSTNTTGFLGGIALFGRSDRLPLQFQIKLSQAVAHSLGLSSHKIGQLHTRDVRWLVYIGEKMEAAKSGMGDDVDNLQLLKALIVVADEVNAAIRRRQEPPAICHCSPEQKLELFHPCGRCFHRTLCADLSFATDATSDILVCSDCSGVAADDGEDDFANSIRRRLTPLLRRDFDRWEVFEDQQMSVLEADLATLIEQQAGMQYPTYRCSYSTIPATTTAFLTPSTMSIEAPLPFGRLADGSLLTHTPDNVISAKYWLNMAHYQFHIGILQEIAIFARSDRAAADMQKLRAVEDRLHRVALSWEPHCYARLKSMTSDEYATLRSSWVSGKPIAGLIGDDEQYLLTRPEDPRPVEGWDEEQQEKYPKVLLDIQQYWGVDVVVISYTGAAPWFKPHGPRSKVWTWDTCFAFYNARLMRMNYSCNRYNQTSESEATLMMENCWQLSAQAAGSAKYATLFGLPKNLWLRSSLSLSFGHLKHGSCMATGWTNLDPSSIQDRDDSKNNMLIETTFENRARWHFADHDVAELLDDLKRVQIPLEYYNPAGTVLKASDVLVQNLLAADDPDYVDQTFFLPQDSFTQRIDVATKTLHTPAPTPATKKPSLKIPQSTATSTKKQEPEPITEDIVPDLVQPPAQPPFAFKVDQKALDTANEYELIQDVAAAKRAHLPLDRALDALERHYKTLTGLDCTLPANISRRPTGSQGQLLPSMMDLWSFTGRQAKGVEGSGDDWATDNLLDYLCSCIVDEGIPDRNTYVSCDLGDIGTFLGQDGAKFDPSTGWEGDMTPARSVKYAMEVVTKGVKDNDASNIYYPLTGMTSAMTRAIVPWTLRGRHFITVVYTVDQKKTGRIGYYDSMTAKDTGDETTKKHWREHKLAMMLIARFASMNPKHPWHGVEWTIPPKELAVTQQTGGDCAFHVAHNVEQLAMLNPMGVDTEDVVERTILGQEYRWEMMQKVLKSILGQAGGYKVVVEHNAEKARQTSRATTKSSKTVTFADTGSSKTAAGTKQQVLISSDPPSSPLPQRLDPKIDIPSSPLFVPEDADLSDQPLEVPSPNFGARKDDDGHSLHVGAGKNESPNLGARKDDTDRSIVVEAHKGGDDLNAGADEDDDDQFVDTETSKDDDPIAGAPKDEDGRSVDTETGKDDDPNAGARKDEKAHNISLYLAVAEKNKATLEKRCADFENRLAYCMLYIKDRATRKRIFGMMTKIEDFLTKIEEGMSVQLGNGEYDIYTNVTRFSTSKLDDDIADLEAMIDETVEG